MPKQSKRADLEKFRQKMLKRKLRLVELNNTVVQCEHHNRNQVVQWRLDKTVTLQYLVCDSCADWILENP